MTVASQPVASPLRPVPPTWAVAAAANGCRLFGTSVLSATALDPEALAGAVYAAYASLAADLRAAGCHALRVWNFVPGIQTPLGGGSRYMAFNAGRFAAYAESYGGADAFSTAVPTASAVGVDGDTLWVHVLAADAAGEPIENPRQIPSYRYSERFGPRPPCFARATRVGSLLLIGGTASILGEDSRHVDHLEAQTRETLANIAALVACAGAGDADGDPLARLSDLRVHVLRPADARCVRAIVSELVPHIGDLELVQADLCRKELLVEIEGRAEL